MPIESILYLNSYTYISRQHFEIEKSFHCIIIYQRYHILDSMNGTRKSLTELLAFYVPISFRIMQTNKYPTGWQIVALWSALYMLLQRRPMSVPKKLKSRNNNSRKTELFWIARIHCMYVTYGGWHIVDMGCDYVSIYINYYIDRASAAHCCTERPTKVLI